MSWGKYLLGMAGVVAGLVVIEQAAPQLAGLYVFVVLLSVVLAHPTFLRELRKLAVERNASGRVGQPGGGS